ncbi:MAG: FtsX-like permease family protein [Acidimicrobiales bacterium]|nr:MAG: FtsX-like permease family protein [Acidimicrobiales bacterium]
MSVLVRKSWQDIRRRRARSLFTAATIALAVVGLSMFAMPPLMDRAMADRIVEDQLHDIRFFTSDVRLDTSELTAIEQVEGVRAVDTRTVYVTRMVVGDRRDDVLIVGVTSFDEQHVNIVGIDSGAAPGRDEAVTDGQNQRSGRFDGIRGATVSIEDHRGHAHETTVSGVGDTLVFGQVATELAVLYVPQDTANALAGTRGVSSIELTVDDPEQVASITEAVRAELLELEPDIVFNDLPDVREAGTWPGQDMFDNFGTLFYVGAILALISAMVLISNTMTTMVAEQVREVAVMKAIGGRRRQVIRSFLTTVLVLAAFGSLAGLALGVAFSNLLVGIVGGKFFGVDPDWGISVPVMIVSFAIGVVGSVLAAIPSLRRAARISVREGLDAGRGLSSSGATDRALRRVPLPHNVRVGLRNMTRRRARSVGTLLQIGLAVGVAIGFLTLGVTVATVTGDTWDAMTWDMIVIQRDRDLDDRAQDVLRDLDGVETVHPLLYNSLEVDGAQLESWGLPPDTPLLDPEILSGRWLVAADEGQRVAVVGRALAATSGVGVGDTLTVGTARGTADLEVVGIDGRLMNNGTTIYLPLTTFEELLGRTTANTFWVRAESQDEADIDRIAAAAEDELSAAGYTVRTEIHYVEREANLAANRTLISVLAAMGVPIVAIGMIGLVNLMTMNVIERTREIGILRCIGARAKDVRRIFRTEALAVAFAGWVLAIPLGWLIGRTLVWVVTEVFDFGSIAYDYPLWYLPVAFVVTIALAALVVVAPVHRAARLRPGDALRYE